MSQNLSISENHEHRWWPWFYTYNVTNNEIHKTKFGKAKKCWSCGARMEGA